MEFKKIECMEDVADFVKTMAGDKSAIDFDIQGRLLLLKAPKYMWEMVDGVIEISGLHEQEIISMFFAVGIGKVMQGCLQDEIKKLKEALKEG